MLIHTGRHEPRIKYLPSQATRKAKPGLKEDGQNWWNDCTVECLNIAVRLLNSTVTVCLFFLVLTKELNICLCRWALLVPPLYPPGLTAGVSSSLHTSSATVEKFDEVAKIVRTPAEQKHSWQSWWSSDIGVSETASRLNTTCHRNLPSTWTRSTSRLTISKIKLTNTPEQLIVQKNMLIEC